MARYLVQNTRPRKPVVFLGRLLAPSITGGKSKCILSEEEYQHPVVQKLLVLARLKLVGEVDEAGQLVTEKPVRAVEVKPVAPPPPPPVVAQPPKTEEAESKPLLDRASLEAKERPELVALAKEVGVKAGGKSANIIDRILEAQTAALES